MSSGIAAQLPLQISNTFGAYGLITKFTTLVKQNLKMLVLTTPGERMMDINFGVGLRQFLFEPNETSTYVKIDEKIRQQVDNYLPYIGITGIEFDALTQEASLYPHKLKVAIRFEIVPLQRNEVLNLEVDIDSTN
tara:strand:- start:2731 stop:3135 length:405 start_codon:yes stop_codon:yes gene_type:complete